MGLQRVRYARRRGVRGRQSKGAEVCRRPDRSTSCARQVRGSMMKRLIPYYLIVSCALLMALGQGQNSNKSEAAAPRPPCADAILIISGSKHWSRDELNRLALQSLWADNSMPRNLRTQVIAHVLPGDPTNMCEFLYVQGFEKPY